MFEYFADEYPGDCPGKVVSLDGAMKKWSGEHGEGYEIDVSKLPKNLTTIRVYLN